MEGTTMLGQVGQLGSPPPLLIALVVVLLL